MESCILDLADRTFFQIFTSDRLQYRQKNYIETFLRWKYNLLYECLADKAWIFLWCYYLESNHHRRIKIFIESIVICWTSKSRMMIINNFAWSEWVGYRKRLFKTFEGNKDILVNVVPRPRLIYFMKANSDPYNDLNFVFFQRTVLVWSQLLKETISFSQNNLWMMSTFNQFNFKETTTT